ncbi:hypothetical protein [Vagococcus salmoninarum]|uniref:Uncharacterized protein n=1 Tax=Vagococcus salmoninarum TaxID=2739 RepID=A0A429ZTG4_9ENTE|nr:hypothetical protein [Vagococcus salmoninarum]MBE9390109.1 hypothetical protein [Vagococcus salmoninarum]RST96978.1 hypothetical protein CBF35_03375 [Vagococcus salmoninarum]
MSNQLVAGTVILNSANGDKKFLVRKSENKFDFVTTPMNQDLTNLACILQELKSEVMMDVNSIDLVELTNVIVENKKMPLFVFEMEDRGEKLVLEEEYVWETPTTLRAVLNKFQVSGVPIFK